MREIIIKLRIRQNNEANSCDLDDCPFIHRLINVCNLDKEILQEKRKCTSPPSFCQVRKHKLVEVIAEGNCIVRIKMVK